MNAELPPNQVWGKRFVIYAALGIPKVRPEDWSFKIDGLVTTPLEFTYDQMLAMPQTGYVKSFHCLLPESVVYANPEPIEIRNVRSGTTIIGRDGKKHGVRRVIRKSHTGKVVGIKASYLPSERMTPEHPVLVVRGHPGVGKSRSKRRLRTFSDGYRQVWARADTLKVGDYVFFPKYRQISSRKFVEYGKHRFPIDEKLAEILGWYVAEGSAGSSDGTNVAFALSSDESIQAERLRLLLMEVFHAKTHVYTNERKTLLRVVTTSNKVGKLALMFKSWCGNDALTKRIPAFILDAKPSVLSSFLASYFQGDGYAPKVTSLDRYRDFIDLTTSSKILAYQLLLALSKMDIPGDMVNHPGSVRDGYSVRVRGERVKKLLPDFQVTPRGDRFHYKAVEDGFYFPIRKIWTEDYSGEVYDFQAPGYTMLSPFVTQDCVTKWSIKDARWEGVALRGLLDRAQVKPEAKWVMFHCVDGYTAPVPLEYAVKDDALLAFKVNGNPLSAEQGFPARPFFPNLYGWKSAKWANRMELIPGYKDGYWEMFGYHERADVWEEERFKGGWGKAVLRKAFGTA